MQGCKMAATTMNTTERLQLDDGTGDVDAHRYRSLVGGLLYLMHTRPDISFPVSIVSRFMQNVSKHHYGATKRILKYVAGTLQFGIWYTNTSGFKLQGYTDSDWASSLDDRRSTSGSVFTLGSGAITWNSKKQEIIALSTTKAEYVAATSSACQTIWLRRLIADFNQEQREATHIYCDNKSTISIARNPTHHGRTKHIDIRFHFIWNLISTSSIALIYCTTDD